MRLLCASSILTGLIGLWLMAFPLVYAGQRVAIGLAALGSGATLGFAALANNTRVGRVRHWALATVGTWLFLWAALGHASRAGAVALAITGAVSWLMALISAVARPA